ncbi:hypothetical protein LTR36_009244 [Oleoguttula mirabilis]|uniref:Uncharacterized protein n=1 Tax=Oleoguttula mirabilis TaxID=1507867 RepID=A0AAV9J5W6_9PEZI|nr:hypothetical protein LTR36_009244 [Oleoguttula mirabilis]
MLTTAQTHATIDSDERIMLVYEHKANGRKLVPDGVSIMSEEDIVMAISAHPDIIMLTKAIEAGQTHVNLYKADLLTDAEKAAAPEPAKTIKSKATKAGTANEEVPWRVFLGHEWEGHSFQELVILTPDPNQAVAKSAEDGSSK